MKYGIISDIHEDIDSLRIALNKIEKFSCDEIVCLGDISGFSVPHYDFFESRNASECLSLVRQNCKIIICGNHDLHAARITPKNSPLFNYPINWYLNDFETKRELSEDKVWLYDQDELDSLYTNRDKEFLKTLPEFIVEGKILFSHYLYPNITGSAKKFYFDISDFDVHKEFMNKKKCEISFSGHQHHKGLFYATNKKVASLRFNKTLKIESNCSILVPPLVRGKYGNGFCIFDTSQLTVEAKSL